MISNSYSDFKSDEQKMTAYANDVKSETTVYAYKSNGRRAPLKKYSVNSVEHVAGLWRVQDKFPHKIENVRKKDFVIGEKLPHSERTLFEFYMAYSVGENCYGKYLPGEPDYVVAKYMTGRGTYAAYGKTIEDARAYLGIKLYDEFQDVIHREINSQHQK